MAVCWPLAAFGEYLVRNLGRAARIVALLLGYYALCVAIIVGLCVADGYAGQYESDHSSDPGVTRLFIILLVISIGGIIISVRGMFVSTRTRKKHLPGIAVTRAEQPELWAHVIELAQRAGVRPPREIRLIPQVNAAVSENAHLLGLVPGKRRLMLGVPLLLALPISQLDSVLGHEFGHYSGQDTRMGPLEARTRRSVEAAVMLAAGIGRNGKARKRNLVPGRAYFGPVFLWYMKIVFNATSATSRKQELAADRLAASLAGRDNTAAALREISVLDKAFDFYLDRYVAPGLDLGLLPMPHQVIGGFAGLLADPKRTAELNEIREHPEPEKPHKWDSHPPMTERVAAIQALPDDGRGLDITGPRGIALVRYPDAVLAALGQRIIGDKARDKRVGDWDALAHARALTGFNQRSKLLRDLTAMLGAGSEVKDFLRLSAQGRLDEMLDRIPPTGMATASGAAPGSLLAREWAKTAAAGSLNAWMAAELVYRGRAGIRHTWSDVGGELVLDPRFEKDLANGVDALFAVESDAAPLYALWTGTGAGA